MRCTLIMLKMVESKTVDRLSFCGVLALGPEHATTTMTSLVANHMPASLPMPFVITDPEDYDSMEDINDQ